MSIKISLLRTFAGKNWKDEAITAIWKKFYKPLAYYVCNCFHLHKDYEDLLQEIMLKIYTHLEHYNEHYSLSTYLYSIARNHCLDYLKKKECESVVYGPQWEARSTGLEEHFLAEEIEREITKTLASFSEEYREIAFLRFYAGKSYKEIAAITGVTLQTVKNRLFRVRNILRKELEEYL